MIIKESTLCRAAEALRHKALTDALRSHSKPEDSREWKEALNISRYLAYLRSQRKGVRNAANAQRDA